MGEDVKVNPTPVSTESAPPSEAEYKPKMLTMDKFTLVNENFREYHFNNGNVLIIEKPVGVFYDWERHYIYNAFGESYIIYPFASTFVRFTVPYGQPPFSGVKL